MKAKKLLLTLLLAFLLATVVIGWRYSQDLDQARQRLAAGSIVAATDCGPIEYARHGSGPAVLLIHGAGGGYNQMADFGRTLATNGFEVIAMSRFGYLRTPMPERAGAEEQADAHACLLDHLGITVAAAVGVSAGAPSAMQWCIRHRQRCSALVLLVPVAYAEGRAAAETTPPSPWTQFVLEKVLMSDFVIWSLTRMAPGVLVETVLATPGEVFDQATAPEQQRALGVIRDIFPVSLKREGLLRDSASSPHVPRYRLEDIIAPVLTISAEDDLYGTYDAARYTASQVPDGHMLGLDSGGHAWLGHDQQVRSAILSFLLKSTAQTHP